METNLIHDIPVSSSIQYAGNAQNLVSEEKWDHLYLKVETLPEYDFFGKECGIKKIYTFIPKSDWTTFQSITNTFFRILGSNIGFEDLSTMPVKDKMDFQENAIMGLEVEETLNLMSQEIAQQAL